MCHYKVMGMEGISTFSYVLLILSFLHQTTNAHTSLQNASLVSSQHENSNRHFLPETVFDVNEPFRHQIISPDFPECCKPMQYILINKYSKKFENFKYLIVEFSDFDLPPGSQFLIYDLKANGTKVLLSAARYVNGAWIHPIISHIGRQLLIEFLTEEHLNERYVGFLGTFWISRHPHSKFEPRDVLLCPPIRGAMEGGKISFAPVVPSIYVPQRNLTCFWLLKPIPESDLIIFIKVLKISRGMRLSVHNGVTSSSPELRYKPYPTTSRNGFYIKLVGPIKGNFTMTYGVFKPVDRPGNCWFKVNGKSVKGYNCRRRHTQTEVQTFTIVKEYICIPLESLCNDVGDCFAFKDEYPKTCLTYDRSAAKLGSSEGYCPQVKCKDGRCPRSSRERCPEHCQPLSMYRLCEGTMLCVHKSYENCPGEPCTEFQKSCADGSCVEYYDYCNDGSEACEPSEKRCESGRCVSEITCCLDEVDSPCPSSRPIKCDDCCHSRDIICDGRRDCRSNEDEIECESYNATGNNYNSSSRVCTAVQKSCADGSCIEYNEICNDGSEPCTPTEKRCENQRCVPRVSLCAKMPCPLHMLKCYFSTKCYPKGSKCDGVLDCPNGDDERDCDSDFSTINPTNPSVTDTSDTSEALWVWCVLPLFMIQLVPVCYLSKKWVKKIPRQLRQEAVQNQRNAFYEEVRRRNPMAASVYFTGPRCIIRDNNRVPENYSQLPDLPIPPSTYGTVLENPESFVPPCQAPVTETNDNTSQSIGVNDPTLHIQERIDATSYLVDDDDDDSTESYSHLQFLGVPRPEAAPPPLYGEVMENPETYVMLSKQTDSTESTGNGMQSDCIDSPPAVEPPPTYGEFMEDHEMYVQVQHSQPTIGTDNSNADTGHAPSHIVDTNNDAMPVVAPPPS